LLLTTSLNMLVLMFGSLIISMVRSLDVFSLWRRLVNIEAPPPSGKPPMDVKDLEPLVPDRAGVKMSWLSTLRLIFKILPAIPRVISNRPSVVDARVQEACVPFTERISPSSTSVGYTVRPED
jgi:hypothetical protein